MGVCTTGCAATPCTRKWRSAHNTAASHQGKENTLAHLPLPGQRVTELEFHPPAKLRPCIFCFWAKNSHTETLLFLTAALSPAASAGSASRYSDPLEPGCDNGSLFEF